MKSPHRGLTASHRFWVAIFALVSLGVMGGGLKYYQYEQDHVRREKYQDLAAIADLKVRQILDWRRERLDDGNRIARSPFLRKAIMDWLQDPSTPGLRAALLERLKSEQEGETIGNVLLTDPDGRILLSVRPDPASLSPVEKQTIEAAIAGRQAVLGDLFRCPKDHLVLLDLAAPVLGPQGRPLAVVVLRINADRVLYPLVQSWPTPSRTAETLLVEVEGKDVLFLNELRHREKTALSLREPLTQKDLPAVQAGLGKQGVFEGRDYRGKKVLADLRPVPQSPWFMVAKVDADEILAEARYRTGITALFVVIFILLTAAVTAYGYRQRQANLYQDLYQMEREQRQAQEEFRTTLYSIGDAVITTDMEGLVKHINPVAEWLTGWLEAEARGKPLEEVFRIINEETRTAVENPVQRVLCEGVVVGLANHTLLVARDDTERPIADSGAPIRDENGAVIGVVLVFRDQTEERAAQNALRESEEKYRLLVNQIPAVVFQGYGDWSVDFFDNKIEILSGYTKEEFDSKKIKWCDLILPEDLNNSHRIFIEALKTDKSYLREYRIRKKDGSISWIQAMGRIFCDDTGKVDHINGVFFDITERKRAEEALKDSEERFRTMVNAIPQLAWIAKSDGYIFWYNQRWYDYTGTTPEEMEGWGWQRVHDPEVLPQVLEQWRASIATGNPFDMVFPLRGGDGQFRRFLTRVMPMKDAYGQVIQWFGTNTDITERKRAEENLRQTRDYLDNLISHANAPIIVWDPSFRITRFNRAFENLMGYSAKEVVGQKLDLLFPEASCEESLSKIARTSVGEYWDSVEIPILHKDGDIRIALWNSANIHAEDGATLVATIAQGQDITERKRAEEALLKYEFIANTANDYMTLINRDYIYEAANAVFCKAHGKTREEVVGASLAYIWGEDRFNNYIKGELDRCFTGQTVESVDWFIFGKMGRGCYQVFYTPYFNEDGTVAYAAVVSHDITARKRDEKALLASEAQYRLLAENVIDVIWTMDLNWKFTYASPSCQSLSGYKDKEIVSMTLDQLLTPDSMDLCKKTKADLLSPENLARQEYPNFILPQLELRFKDGSRSVYIEIKGSFLKDSQGQPMGMMGVTRDITERKQLEEQFLQAQKMEAVGTLAGGIAHDFNNILTAILGNVGLAALDEKIGTRSKKRLAQAEAACLRAEALSQQLLTFAKGGAPVKKLFSMAELLTESTAFACVGSPVRCETDFPENLWSIEADPGQIGQVFQNITINAIQAMPTGGTIKVWAENQTLGTESGLPLSAGRYIKISVRDQGMGIPAEHLPRIFEPYFTTKQKGSGLDLASTYAIINKHHGYIVVESTPGVGTTFYIYLPAVDQQVTPQPEEDKELLVGTGKILVMDDEEMVREVLGRLLARLGYEAEFAGDGGEAIERFVQAQGSGQAFTAVILDLTVPVGMGGKETLARLLEIDPQVKAIVSSGYSDDLIMADFQKYGFSGVIAKPYRVVELSKILQGVITKMTNKR